MSSKGMLGIVFLFSAALLHFRGCSSLIETQNVAAVIGQAVDIICREVGEGRAVEGGGKSAGVGERARTGGKGLVVGTVDWYHSPFETGKLNYIGKNNITIENLSTDDGLGRTGKRKKRELSRSRGSVDGQQLYRVHIESVQSKDAGLYECRIEVEVNHSGDVVVEITSFASHLIVLASEPVCHRVYHLKDHTDGITEGDIIQLQCSVGYRGIWAPHMEWGRKRRGNNSSGSDGRGGTVEEGMDVDWRVPDGITNFNTTNVSVTTTFIIKAAADLQMSRFVCRTRFSESITPTPETELLATSGNRKSAANRPSYSHIWKSEEINIWYGPKATKISSSNGIHFQPGDVLVCSADSNPSPPHFRWTNLKTGSEVATGPHLTISRTMAAEVIHRYMCTSINARNHAHSENDTIEFVVVHNSGDRSFSSASASSMPIIPIIITVSASTVVIVCIVSILLFYGLRKINRLTDATTLTTTTTDELLKRGPVASTTIDVSEQRNNVRGLDVIDDVVTREETSLGEDDSSSASTHTYTDINESGDIVYYNDPPVCNPYTGLNARGYTGAGVTEEGGRGGVGGGGEGGGDGREGRMIHGEMFSQSTISNNRLVQQTTQQPSSLSSKEENTTIICCNRDIC